MLLVTKWQLPDEIKEHYIQDSEISQLFHATSVQEMLLESKHDEQELSKELYGVNVRIATHLTKFAQDEGSDVYVFAVQGKSVHTHLWKLESLLASNANLTEIAPKIEKNQDQFVVHKGGVKRGLCDKLVILACQQQGAE